MGRVFKEGGEHIFSTGYVPDELPHREEQIKQLVDIIRDGLEVDAYHVPILYGETGTGKTTTIIHVLNIIDRRYKGRVQVKRVNATIKNRSYLAITDLAEKFIPVPPRGLSIEEILSRLYDKLDIQDMQYVFAIDDADELIRREKGKILELLTRIEENYDRRLLFPIIVVRNLKYIDALPSHITSKLGGLRIAFPPYKKRELKDILKERIEKGIRDGGITQNAIECATYNVEKLLGGNARELLNIILMAGKLVERRGGDKIESEHIRQALYESYSSRLSSGLTIKKPRDKKYRVLWAIYKVLHEEQDKYYIDDEIIQEAFEIYKTTFQIEDLNKEDIPDILLDMAIYEKQNLIALDEGRLAAAHYPVSLVFQILTNNLFF